MKDSIIDKLLSMTGYLTPRNEEEMKAFEKIYSEVGIDKDFHVDVDQIVNGSCCHIEPMAQNVDTGMTMDMRMAARNYEAMPKDVIEKIKKQHEKKDDKGE